MSCRTAKLSCKAAKLSCRTYYVWLATQMQDKRWEAHLSLPLESLTRCLASRSSSALTLSSLCAVEPLSSIDFRHVFTFLCARWSISSSPSQIT